MIAHQDYELAEQLMNADLSFQHDKDENGDPDYPSITKKVYHLEAIFLDLTDRTQAHPKYHLQLKIEAVYFKILLKIWEWVIEKLFGNLQIFLTSKTIWLRIGFLQA